MECWSCWWVYLWLCNYRTQPEERQDTDASLQVQWGGQRHAHIITLGDRRQIHSSFWLRLFELKPKRSREEVAGGPRRATSTGRAHSGNGTFWGHLQEFTSSVGLLYSFVQVQILWILNVAINTLSLHLWWWPTNYRRHHINPNFAKKKTSAVILLCYRCRARSET